MRCIDDFVKLEYEIEITAMVQGFRTLPLEFFEGDCGVLAPLISVSPCLVSK